MKEKISGNVDLGEDVPGDQIEALGKKGRQLFSDAKKRFGAGRLSIGRADAAILDCARYRARGGEMVTVMDSSVALQDTEPVAGSITILLETPLPQSFHFPNTYVYERFTFAPFAPQDCDYSMGVNEYTLDGDIILSGHPVEEVREAYPAEMEPFQAQCGPGHFTDQMLTVVQLAPVNEVGCDPNPYYRVGSI